MLIVKKAYDADNMLGNIFTIESKLHSGNGYMHEWHLYKKYGGGMIYRLGRSSHRSDPVYDARCEDQVGLRGYQERSSTKSMTISRSS